MIAFILSHLKRLSTYPIFWVISSLSLVLIPHITRFPIWSTLLIFGLFTWRLVGISHPKWLPPTWLLIIISLLSASGIYFVFGTIFGKTAGSVLLSTLLAIKIHESNTRRDYMLLISLSFFVIATNFLFSQDILTLILMLLSVFVLIISMMSINQGLSIVPLKEKIKFSSKLLAQAIPLMLILFVLFPRLPGPLWQLPDEQHSATSGLSDSLSPGDISSLIQSNALAFRVKFKDEIPEQSKLYWRALVLWYFDGKTWQQGNNNLTTSPQLYTQGKTHEYTVTLEPHQKKWLFALDIPVKVPSNILYTNNFVLRSNTKIQNLFQYSVVSDLSYNIQTELSPWERSAGLKIPLNKNKKTIQLGQRLNQQYPRPEDIINHVLTLFNQENFYYTLHPPLTQGADPVDQFLFTTRRGFCGHYASSFTLLMRAAGIPARIVLGYQGGTLNPLNQVLSVRQRDAHSWSEVWLKGKGWIRIDPTASIAPQRIESGLDAALDPSERRPFYMRINSGMVKNIIFYWDALDNHWNQLIVGYDTQAQKELLNNIFDTDLSTYDIVLIMLLSFGLLSIFFTLYIIKPWKKKTLSPTVKFYNIFCKKLSKKNIHRASHEGPNDFSIRAITALPASKNSILLITRLYISLRYKSSTNAKQLAQLKQLVKAFKAH